jgi:prolyl-tRNA synthetase
MMQDGKALQAGTSHYLGQNFAEAAGIRFQNKDGAIETAYTTSWGVSTRLIGAVIMTHADDNGLRLPPAVAPQQVVIVPILREGADNEQVLAFCNEVVQQARTQSYQGSRIRIKLDDRDLPSADKRWQWIKKGVPLIVEIGPKDVEKGSVALTRRVDLEAKKEFIPLADFTAQLPAMLQASHDALYQAALAIRQQRLRTDITTLEQFKAYFGESGDESYTKGQGFVQAWWNGDEEAAEPLLKAMGLTIRCIPFDQPKGQTGPCVLTGQQANKQVIFARAY